MVAHTIQDNVVTVNGEVPTPLNVAALASSDGRNVTVRVVNSAASDIIVYLAIVGFDGAHTASVWTLASPDGVLNATNPATEPNRIVPVSRRETFINGGSFLFPRASFTVINVEQAL